MGTTIEQYAIVDASNNEDDRIFDTLDEAQAVAEKEGAAVIARIFEYSDSELVWTPDGGDAWPPGKDSSWWRNA